MDGWWCYATCARSGTFSPFQPPTNIHSQWYKEFWVKCLAQGRSDWTSRSSGITVAFPHTTASPSQVNGFSPQIGRRLAKVRWAHFKQSHNQWHTLHHNHHQHVLALLRLSGVTVPSRSSPLPHRWGRMNIRGGGGFGCHFLPVGQRLYCLAQLERRSISVNSEPQRSINIWGRGWGSWQIIQVFA